MAMLLKFKSLKAGNHLTMLNIVPFVLSAGTKYMFT